MLAVANLLDSHDEAFAEESVLCIGDLIDEGVC